MHLSFLSPPLPLSLPPILSPCADGSHPPSLPALAPLVPRPATSSPLCSAFALAAALAGRDWDGPADLPQGPGLRLALFPQEFYRDPGSAWLRTLPSDAPWDDPGLFATMLKLG